MKECTSCGVIKPHDHFHSQGAGRERRPACRKCISAAQQMRDRVARGGCLSEVATQPTAEAHRVWMAVDREWGGERRWAA